MARPSIGSKRSAISNTGNDVGAVPAAYAERSTMQGTVLYAPGDVRLEQRPEPKIVNPTDAIIRIAATCVCGSRGDPSRAAPGLYQAP